MSATRSKLPSRATTLFHRSLGHIQHSRAPFPLPPSFPRFSIHFRISRRFTTSTQSRPLSLRTYIYAATFTLFGLTIGQVLRHAYVPPAAPEPGTRADDIILRQKEKDIDNLAIVQRHRDHDEWRELAHVGSKDDTQQQGGSQGGRSDDGRRDVIKSTVRSLTKAAMSGSRGLGVQRTFWNEEKGELVKIVWFGQGLSGWPGVAHGGAIATVFEEALRHIAAGSDKDWTTLPEEPNTLNLSYVKPTLANNFYVIRGMRSVEKVTERDGINPRKPKDGTPTSKEIDATLETLDGKILVKARGTFTDAAIAQTKAEMQRAGKSTWHAFTQSVIPKRSLEG
ncbi:hypothetical protein EV356DRAFT_529661 [Viridothelium virens]|uniref:Thioesterase domain-containing protein n=1 Tax=Viridothelium virens TaxID=1048519 RepID=A0A6A6HIT1_VIRVR|nr:hypothetical protein EV356DRAFT_529661 [Viridothelium virens]